MVNHSRGLSCHHTASNACFCAHAQGFRPTLHLIHQLKNKTYPHTGTTTARLARLLQTPPSDFLAI